MQGWKMYVAPAVALLLVIGYWVFAPDVEEGAQEGTGEDPGTDEAKAKAKAKAEGEAKAQAKTKAKAKAKATAKAREKDRAHRDLIAARIQRAIDDSREEAPAEAETFGELDKEYIQQRIKDDLIPLAQECYESVLEDDDAVAGRMVMKFAIVGEHSVGGVVEGAEVDPQSEIKHPALIECMTESMMSVTFDPPEGGGRVEVTYPFIFDQAEPQ